MSCLLSLPINSTHKPYYPTWQQAYLTSGEPPAQDDSIRCVYIQLLIEEIQFLPSAFLSHSVFQSLFPTSADKILPLYNFNCNSTLYFHFTDGYMQPELETMSIMKIADTTVA